MRDICFERVCSEPHGNQRKKDAKESRDFGGHGEI